MSFCVRFQFSNKNYLPVNFVFNIFYQFWVSLNKHFEYEKCVYQKQKIVFNVEQAVYIYM